MKCSQHLRRSNNLFDPWWRISALPFWVHREYLTEMA
jgi:hypothetical protein